MGSECSTILTDLPETPGRPLSPLQDPSKCWKARIPTEAKTSMNAGHFLVRTSVYQCSIMITSCTSRDSASVWEAARGLDTEFVCANVTVMWCGTASLGV